MDAEAELAAIPLPPPLGVYLMAYFWDLHSTRQSNGMCPSRLTRAEIRQWEFDEARPLARWERKTLMAIDAAWFTAASATEAKPELKEEA